MPGRYRHSRNHVSELPRTSPNGNKIATYKNTLEECDYHGSEGEAKHEEDEDLA